jgi:hypothetical protein
MVIFLESKMKLDIGTSVWIREKDNDEGKYVLSGPHEIQGVRTDEVKCENGTVTKYNQYKIVSGQSYNWIYETDVYTLDKTLKEINA